VNESPAITGIRRGKEYSPSHEDDDWRILKLTAEELERLGHSVELVDEEQVGLVEIGSPVIFNMCQGPAANSILRDLEKRGRLMINRPSSCLHTLRIPQLTLLADARIPIATSYFIDTEKGGPIPDEVRDWPGVWVKRGEVHSTEPGDVIRLEDAAALAATIAEFHERGIGRVVVQRHLEGPVVKFYAVKGSDFFRWYPFRGEPQGSIDEAGLRVRAEASAAALGLEVYGGECVLVEDGSLPVIDVNDWPSFARFREEAAAVIAAHIVRRGKDDGKL
jgi:hypothetical protein